MSTFKNAIKNLVKGVFSNLIIETKDKVTDKSFFVISSHKPLVSYSDLYLGKGNDLSNKVSFSFNILKRISALSKKSGLIIIRDTSIANRIKDQVVMLPNFIELEIPLPATLEEYYKTVTSDVHNNLKKVKKIDFNFTISDDINWVDDFYNDYYVPSMVARHDDAYVMPKNEMRASVKHDGIEFLKVNLDNQCVAAAITMVEGDKYSYAKVGWLNGDNDILAKGAVTAIYQQLVERAFAVGSKSISLGGTPPFLENGVLRYKAKWQSRFNPDIYYGENFLLISPSNETCYKFLQNNSLLVFGLNKRLIVLSSKLRAETHIPGIIFDDIKGWFILRSKRSESYPDGMDDLPEHLRYWYDKVI